MTYICLPSNYKFFFKKIKIRYCSRDLEKMRKKKLEITYKSKKKNKIKKEKIK